MQNDQELINDLKRILVWKKSKAVYANHLGVSVEKINELLLKLKLEDLPIETKSAAKILLLDIETSLLLATVFQKQVWKARIGHEQLISDYYILTWSAKWLGNKEIMSNRLTPEEVYNEDDSRIVGNLLTLIDSADIIIGHNSDTFDIPNIFTRGVQHGYPPPSPFRQIDTLKIAQRYFGFTHNSLDALAKFFHIEGKIPTTLELWKGCIMGDEDSLIEMEVYNRQDVIVLEKIFYKLRPYAKGLPNMDMYIDEEFPTCTSCGSSNIFIQEDKFFYTNATKFKVFRCNDCGSISRSRKGIKLDYTKSISPIPR